MYIYIFLYTFLLYILNGFPNHFIFLVVSHQSLSFLKFCFIDTYATDSNVYW